MATIAGVAEKVHVDKNGKVDKDKVHLYKSKDDQIVWTAEAETIISFGSAENSPFTEWKFTVQAGGSAPSGRIKDNAGAEKQYDYTVEAAGSQNDPSVIIHK
ncbi:MAG TPA: hypothetical protein VF532_06855 [Candidatus Angelobacter sp.]